MFVFSEKGKNDFLHKENDQYKGVMAWKTLVELRMTRSLGVTHGWEEVCSREGAEENESGEVMQS